MARAEQGGGRGWRGCQPYGMRRAYDANLHKENAAWDARDERRASSGGRAELREDNAVIEAYAELRRDGRGYGSYSPHRHHRLFHEKYGRRYKEDEGDPELGQEDEVIVGYSSMSPMVRLRKEELGELPPQLITVTLDRGGTFSKVLKHRQDVLDSSLSSLGSEGLWSADEVHIVFADENEWYGNRVRLSQLPSRLKTIRDIEWYHWRWVKEICWTKG